MSTGKTVTIHDKKRVFDGWVKVDEYTVSHTGHDGTLIGPFKREVVERGHAVAVILYDPQNDAVVLLRQFRLPAYAAPLSSDPEGAWPWEFVAGIIEPGESPKDVAIRETYEETGINITDVQSVHKFYMSPGSLTETIELFYAQVDSTQVKGLHGLDSEYEDIAVHVLTWKQIETMMEQKLGITNVMTLLSLYWLKDHRQK